MRTRLGFVRPLHNVRNGIHLIRNRKTMWQMLRETLRGEYKMSFFTIVAIFLSITYVISPIDLIPDFIPVIGWIDDGFVIYLLLKRLTTETQRYNRTKAMARRS